MSAECSLLSSHTFRRSDLCNPAVVKTIQEQRVQGEALSIIIDEGAAERRTTMTLDQHKPAIIDYNSIIRNCSQLLPSLIKIASVGLKILTGVVGASMGLLLFLGVEQGYRLAKGQLECFMQAKSRPEKLLASILTLVGVGYVGLSICAGIIGVVLLAGLRIAISGAVMGGAVAALTVCGLAMYVGAAVYAFIRLCMNISFRIQLHRVIREEGKEAALQFLKRNPHLAERTNPLIAELVKNGDNAEELIALVLKANAMEIVGDFLLLLVGILGTLSFILAPPIGHAIFIGVAVLWLYAIDHPELVHKARTKISGIFT